MVEPSLVNRHAIVWMLINDLANIDNEVFLFPDDYHLVTDPAIRGAVSFCLGTPHRIFTWSLQRPWSHRYRLADCLPRTSCSRAMPLSCALTPPSQGRSRLVALPFIRRAPTFRYERVSHPDYVGHDVLLYTDEAAGRPRGLSAVQDSTL